MAGNVLQSIGLTPDWFKSVMGGVISDPSQPDPEAQAAPPPVANPSPTGPDGANLLQTLNQGAPANAVQPQAPPAPAAAPPRTRRSLLDTVGRISDVLAKVGGADALYQPTLDAREDRSIALDDHSRAVDLDKLKIALAGEQVASGQMDNTTQSGKIAGQAIRGLQAILKANPQANVAAIWPMLAKQAGVDPAHIAAIGEAIASDPTSLEGIASMLSGDQPTKYGGSVVYATGPDGKLAAFQPGLGNDPGRNVLPEGFVPVDPAKFVDTGNAQVGVGSRSGNVVRTLPKGVSPDQAARDATAITVAGMPARNAAGGGAGAKPGKAEDTAAGNKEALIALDNLERGFQDLHRLNALPGDTGGGLANNILQGIGRTGPGQYLGEQAGSAAAQRRVAMGKTINTLQQTLIKALPASATRTKFEQEILAKSLPDPTRMSLSTAREVIGDYRAIFQRAQAAAAAERAKGGTGGGARAMPPKLPGKATTRPPASRAPGKPSVSNW